MKFAICGLIAFTLSVTPAAADTLWWGCHRGGEDFPNCGKSVCDIGQNMTVRIDRSSDSRVSFVHDYPDQDTGGFGPYVRPAASRAHRIYPNGHLALDNNGRILRYNEGDFGRYVFDLREKVFRIEFYNGDGNYKNTDFVCEDIEPIEN
jgi:hypothetical protein